jgi:hypothetical protein
MRSPEVGHMKKPDNEHLQPTPFRRIIARSRYDPRTGTRPDLWEALDEDGAVIVPSAKDPFLEGCRVLLKRGVDPDTLVTMQHEGGAHVSFVPIRLKHAAKLALSERTERSVRFGPWRPLGGGEAGLPTVVCR